MAGAIPRLSLQKGATAAELPFHRCKSRQNFRVQRIFTRISPNLPNKLLSNFSTDFLPQRSWIRFLDLPPKILFMCFFANLGASLWSQATLDAIFSRIFRVYSKSKLFGVRSPPCTSTSNNTAFHNSIVGNFVVYQDRLETNLLQLFGHPEDSKWFSVISVIIFPVNIVDEQKQT